MKLKYISHEIVATRTIDSDTFVTVLAVTFKDEDDVKNLFGSKTEQIEVIQNNSMTGYEMDIQCKNESINFVNNL